MIELLILFLHILAALYAFTKNWQQDSVKNGFMAIVVIGLVFTIGWALTGPIARVIMPNSWETVYFTKDTLSLVLLFIPECFFFNMFFVKDGKKTVEANNQ